MKTILSILINATVLCIIWIFSTLIANAIMGVEPPVTDNASYAVLLMWICCWFEAAALHLYLINNRQSKWHRALMVFGSIFIIQFVFTQVESLYYIDHQTMPAIMILNTVISGFLTAILFTGFLSWRYPETRDIPNPNLSAGIELLLILLLGVIVYPVIYFTAGYFIAWQSEALRIYYSGSSELSSFAQVMKDNLQSGVYTFQAIRGVLWAAFGILLIRSLRPTDWKVTGIILGLLFACLMTAQLLIPNPYMPSGIRMTHLFETASSNLIWGIVISQMRYQLMRISSINTVLTGG